MKVQCDFVSQLEIANNAICYCYYYSTIQIYLVIDQMKYKTKKGKRNRNVAVRKHLQDTVVLRGQPLLVIMSNVELLGELGARSSTTDNSSPKKSRSIFTLVLLNKN